MQAATGHMKPILGANDEAGFFIWQNGKWDYLTGLNTWEDQGVRAMKRLQEPGFFERVDREQRASCNALELHAFRLRDADISVYSNEDLAKEYRSLSNEWIRMCVWGHVINVLDFEHYALSHKIMDFIEAKRVENNVSESTAELFSILTTPAERSLFIKQDEHFLEMLKAVQSDKSLLVLFETDENSILTGVHRFPVLDKPLDSHVRQFDWMQYHYDGPEILDRAYFIRLLKAELHQNANAEEQLRQMREKQKELAVKQRDMENRMEFSGEERLWIQVARACVHLKGLRKDVIFRSSRNVRGFLTEIGKRLGVSLKHVRYLTMDEAEALLKKNQRADETELETRLQKSVFYADNGRMTIFTGNHVEKYRSLIVAEEAQVDVRELKGTPACAGVARGTVKIIVHADEMGKMNEGDILVSVATNPNLVPAMKKAAAIVTDEGGLTCHAAIVSREMGIPCIVGTKKATKAFKDGDEVEVNATNGIVRKL